jgi:chromate reductase, NAD(P)H dehydrogenase (quinone)
MRNDDPMEQVHTFRDRELKRQAGDGDVVGKIKILGFAGSLRQGSYNRALLRAASQLVPPEATLEIFDLEGIPLYNADQESYMPEKVKAFKQKIREADALLIVTPEYNHSVSGVLKNAIDYASRPAGDNPFNDKPVATMSASTSLMGGVRAQFHLRQIFVFLNMHPVNVPQIFVGSAAQKFNEKGDLLDEKAKDLIKQLFSSLIAWTKRIKIA